MFYKFWCETIIQTVWMILGQFRLNPLPDSGQNNLFWMILGQFQLNLPPRLRSLRRHCSAITADNIQQRPVGRKLLRL